MQKIPKFRIVFWKDIPERMHVVDETNFFPKYFFGLDGLLYENYGLNGEPLWEVVFDSDYEIELVEERRIITIPIGSTKKWWQFWKMKIKPQQFTASLWVKANDIVYPTTIESTNRSISSRTGLLISGRLGLASDQSDINQP